MDDIQILRKKSSDFRKLIYKSLKEDLQIFKRGYTDLQGKIYRPSREDRQRKVLQSVKGRSTDLKIFKGKPTDFNGENPEIFKGRSTDFQQKIYRSSREDQQIFKS